MVQRLFCDDESYVRVRELGSSMPYGKGQPQTACATQERSKRDRSKARLLMDFRKTTRPTHT